MQVKPIKCLLIDDDLDDQEIFLMAIQKLPWQVECSTANSAKKGLEMLSAGSGFIPDYIFLDLNLPGIDGKKCLQELRKMPHLQATPVIMYSTSSYINDIRETKKLGATGFLTKPSDINVLVKTLSEIFSNKYDFQTSIYYQ